MRIRAPPSPAQRLLRQPLRSRHLWYWEKLCWSGLLLFTAAPHGMRWLQVGRPCSPRWRMLDIHSLDWSLAIAPDFPRHYFTPPSMPSHSSVHSASSPWCGAKLAATISQTLPDWLPDRLCLRDACLSSCCHWQGYRRSPGFLENFIFSVLRFAPVQTTACSGSWQSRFSAALSRFTIT